MDAKTEKDNLIEGETGPWEVVIGMEVHAQVTSNAKLFSGASTEFGGEPNSHVSLVDAAMPGMLPVINEGCIAQHPHRARSEGENQSHPISTGRTISTPTCRRAIRSATIEPVVARARSCRLLSGERVTVGIERLHLERTRAKACTISTRNIPMSISTARAWR
jgi:aspartyl-tRNA(Asn)/glutamyl-tRNA(Gln) amidotransferase subunit B